jgi:murein L,D-transpeptidase YafK
MFSTKKLGKAIVRIAAKASRVCIIFAIIISFQYFFWSEITTAYPVTADKVIVIKSKRILLLMKDGEIIKAYRVVLGKQPKGPKVQSGDKKTPEGTYILDSREAKSKFHLSIHISYPNESDIMKARKSGVSPGGGIMIHGLPNGLGGLGKLHRYYDWTNGCIAVTDGEIEEIWQMVKDGTPIEIKP